jgi:hypothetical protein
MFGRTRDPSWRRWTLSRGRFANLVKFLKSLGANLPLEKGWQKECQIPWLAKGVSNLPLEGLTLLLIPPILEDELKVWHKT